MSHNPLTKIKDVAVGTIKVPLGAAGTALDLAKGTAGHVAKTVTGTVAGVAGAAGVGPKEQASPAEAPEAPQAPEGQAVSPEEVVDHDLEKKLAETSKTEPVNVTEELGLDPAPVEKPTEKPLTKIDAKAEDIEVDVTPADIADRVFKDD